MISMDAGVIIVGGLVVVQVIYGAYSVLLAWMLSLGLNPLFLVAGGSLTTSAFLLPFALPFERNKWPGRLSPRLMLQFVLIAIGGVTAFQALMLVGIEKTSPAVASAMPNLAPAFIFFIAASLGLEKMNIRCRYSRAKILGTFMCITGAISLSLLQNPSSKPTTLTSDAVYYFITTPLPKATDDGDWIVGCIYLLSAVFFLSCTTVLQATTMKEFPAPLTLCVITSLIGGVLTTALQLILEGKLDSGLLPGFRVRNMFLLILLGGVMTGICIAFQTWSVKKRGPVLVSMLSPVGTICSALISALTLQQPQVPLFNNLGSLAGMLVMFAGLYFVLWAKKKEDFLLLDDYYETPEQVKGDIEKPLLN